jgi:hypothetical protein
MRMTAVRATCGQDVRGTGRACRRLPDMDDSELERRKLVLLDLVERRVPVPQAVTELARFPWDCDMELVQLRRTHLFTVLDEFQRGSISASDVEDWAEALTGRDDVAVDDEELREALFQLSTPELFDPLHVAAAVWVSRLGT